MKALVTGGSGFIGGYVVRELERRNYDVEVWDLNQGDYYTNARFKKVDLANKESVMINAQNAYPNVIFHCAGLLGTKTLFNRIEQAEMVNVLGTIRILTVASEKMATVVQPNLLGTWLNPYMLTKNQAERYGFMFAKETGLRYISVKPTDVYGPRQGWAEEKAAPVFMIKALRGEPIPVYGNGDSWVNYVYAGDVAKMLVNAYELGADGSETICFSDPEGDMPIRQFAEKIIQLSGSKSTLQYLPMREGQPGEIERIEHSLDAASRYFNMESLMSLDEGIKKSLAWYSCLI